MKALRDSFEATIANVDPESLVFIDEMGISTKLQRTHARSPRGQRAHGTKPGKRCDNISIIGAIGLEKGLHSVTRLPKALDKDLFALWLIMILIPKLKPGQTVVMDNLPSHKTKEAKALIRGAGCKVLYQPPYSPQYNPIEMAWSKLKAYLRKQAQHTEDGLIDALRDSLSTVEQLDVDGWFRHAGYCVIS